MLHILFIILKIFGILLLSVLGLVFICLLTVLFVPIRYKGDVKFQSIKEIVFHAHIHWLFHIISLRILYKDELKYELKIFGHQFHKNEDENNEDADDDKCDEYTKDDSDSERIMKISEAFEQSENPEHPEPSRDPEELLKMAEDASRKTDNAIEKAEEAADLLEELVKRRSLSEKENDDKFPESEMSKAVSVNPSDEDIGKINATKNKKGTFFSKIFLKIKDVLLSLKQKSLKFRTSTEELKNKCQAVLGFFQNEENRYSIRLIREQLKRLFKHIFPRKISGNITFGIEDPYLMGQILSAAAFCYPLYGKQLMIKPVMNTDVIDGDVNFKGCIRVGVLVYIALRIWMNKNIRIQFHNYRNRGGR